MGHEGAGLGSFLFYGTHDNRGHSNQKRLTTNGATTGQNAYETEYNMIDEEEDRANPLLMGSHCEDDESK